MSDGASTGLAYWKGVFSSLRVSPVVVHLSLAMATMAPGPAAPLMGFCSLPTMPSNWPTRSFSSLPTLSTVESGLKVPESTRTTLSWPAKGSARVLNTKAAMGPSSATSSSASSPCQAAWSRGEGKRSCTMSRIRPPPMFMSAEPQATGTSSPERTPARMPWATSSGVSSPSSRYFSMSSSSASAMFSTMVSRRDSTSSAMSPGISPSDTPPSASKSSALPPRTSTTPLKSSLEPMGMYRSTGLMPSMFTRLSKAMSKSARSRSILLMKTMEGRPAAWTSSQSFLVKGLAPSTASTVKTTPSAAVRENPMSPVKLLSPGVSMRKCVFFFQA